MDIDMDMDEHKHKHRQEEGEWLEWAERYMNISKSDKVRSTRVSSIGFDGLELLVAASRYRLGARSGL